MSLKPRVRLFAPVVAFLPTKALYSPQKEPWIHIPLLFQWKVGLLLGAFHQVFERDDMLSDCWAKAEIVDRHEADVLLPALLWIKVL